MNVQGRRGGLSCDNKGECLIHKKKKKKKSGWWQAKPLISGSGRRAVTARTRGRPPQAPGPKAGVPASVATAVETAHGGGKKPNPTTPPRGGWELHLGLKIEKDTDPMGGGGSGWEPLGRRAPSIVSPRACELGTHACARTRARVHIHSQALTRTHTHTRPPAARCPHAPARPRRTRLGSAPQAASTPRGACPGPTSACTHTCTRRGTRRRLQHAGSRRDLSASRPPRSRRPVLRSLGPVFYE